MSVNETQQNTKGVIHPYQMESISETEVGFILNNSINKIYLKD